MTTIYYYSVKMNKTSLSFVGIYDFNTMMMVKALRVVISSYVFDEKEIGGGKIAWPEFFRVR